MNADHDPLEAELAGMRPVDLSPALRERLARHAEPGRPVQLSGGRWLLLGVGLAAAASVILALLSGRDQPAPPIPGPEIGPRPPVASASRSHPTLFAYQEALKESDESFDALLNHHEPRLSANGASSESVTVSSLSHGLFKDLLGDR